MKEISLMKHYNISDAGNETKIRQILDSIALGDESEVNLDLLHCIIDYPATSMLIDHILVSLTALGGHKKMTIQVSYLLPEQTLINDLLGDSIFFGIEAKREIPIYNLQKVINEKLTVSDIELLILIKNRAGEIRKEYKYGN